jgi:predicted phosphodiesterase
VGLLGAWIALLLAGRHEQLVGPFRVELFARPGSGVTEIALPPFGRVEADTHGSPLRLTAQLQEVAATELSEVVGHKGVDGLALEVEEEGLDALRGYVWRALGLVLLGGAVAGAAVFRGRWRPAAGAALSALLVFGAATGASWLTYRPEAFLSPTYTGSLALAPRFLGPLEEATGRIDDFRVELERLVGGAVQAYGTFAEIQPTATSDVVLLHISDVHLSPIGMDFAQRLAESFQVDLVVDTGDLTSFGTALEQGIVGRIRAFEVPYVFVRGNHDSALTVEEVSAVPNAVVLNHESQEVAGVRIHGAPHPLFTPTMDRNYPDDAIEDTVRTVGDIVAREVAGSPAVDILAAHDPRMVEASSGAVPLALSGHFHRTLARSFDGMLLLEVGTTGGGGLDTFAGTESIPLEAEILYLDGDPPRLVAWDAVSLDPVTGDLTMDRRLPSEVLGEQEPAPRGEPAPTP